MSTEQDITAVRQLNARVAAVYPAGGLASVGGVVVASNPALLASPAGATVTLRSATFQWWLNSITTPGVGDVIRWVRVTTGGEAANNANAKNVALTLAGTTMFSLDLQASAANKWWIELLLSVPSSLGVNVMGFGAQGPDTPTFALPAVATVAIANILAPQTLATVVTQTAASDVTQRAWLVEAWAVA